MKNKICKCVLTVSKNRQTNMICIYILYTHNMYIDASLLECWLCSDFFFFLITFWMDNNNIETTHFYYIYGFGGNKTRLFRVKP